MRVSSHLLVGALLVLCGSVCLARPSLVATRLSGPPPTLDGEVATDPAWPKAASAAGFALLGKAGALASQQTEARVLADDGHLYFAFVCREDQMGGIAAKVKQADGATWEDDCVEVFLAPCADRGRYYHFVVNAGGVLRDELRRDEKWNSGATAAAKRSDGFWSAELAVPLTALDLDETVGSAWGANLCRGELPHKETSSWAPCQSGFHEPGSFGDLTGVVVDLAQMLPANLRRRVAATLTAVGTIETATRPYAALSQGRAVLAGCARGRTELAAVGARLGGALDGPQAKGLGAQVAQVERGVTRWRAQAERLPIIEAAGKAGYVVCAESTMVKVRPDAPYQGRPGRPLSITLARNEYEAAQLVVIPVQAGLDQVAVSAGDLRGPGGATLPASALQLNRVGYVQVKESSGGAMLPAGWLPDPLLPNEPADIAGDRVQSWWLTAHAGADQQAGVYRGEVAIKPANAPETKVPLEVRVWNFALPTTSRLRTSYGLNLGSVYARYELAAPGRPSGWEWGQWTGADVSGIANYYGTMAFETAFDPEIKHEGKRSCRVHVTDLKPGTRETPRLAYMTHLTTLKPDTDYELSAWYRTAPGDESGPAIFMSAVKEHRLLPTEGAWRQASITFNTGNNTDQYAYFKVDQIGTAWWDDLCLAPKGVGATGNILPNPSFERGDEGGRERLRDLYFLDALKHRASPTSLLSPQITIAPDGAIKMDWTEFDQKMGEYIAQGLNAFNVNWCQLPSGWGTVETVADQQRIARAKELLRQTQAHLEGKGWTQLAYIYTIDEPGFAAFPQVKQAFELAHEAAPKLKRLLTYGYGASKPLEPGHPRYADLAGFVDIHVPHSDCIEPVYLEQRRQAGDEIWCYVCISAQRPYLNVWGIDYPGLDHRLLYWQMFQQGITGFLYWEICYWQVDPWQSTLTYPGGNADGSLLYPGPQGPVDSVRWELVRDGTEDYDMLVMLKEAAAKAGTREPLLDFPQLTSSWTQYTQDPAALERLRLQVGERLEKLSRTAR